jgi:hypothetical protein
LSSVSLVKTWWRVLTSQDQALANAREAATALSRRRVEREEVALFLEEHAASRLASVRQAVPR